MADSYSDLVQLVRDWSNRDSGALPDTIIQSSLRYAADTAYRTLMIPPLETSVYYIIASDNYQQDADGDVVGITTDSLPSNVAQVIDTENIKLPIPADAVLFKHLRVMGTFDVTTVEDDDGVTTSATADTDDNGNLRYR